MCSYLSKEGKVELRLPAGEREAFLKKYKTKLCEAYGIVQPEYVEVPGSLLSSTRELKKFFGPDPDRARALARLSHSSPCQFGGAPTPSYRVDLSHDTS